MKKLVFFAFIIIFSGTTLAGWAAEPSEVDSDYQVIPDEAIRLRILANSDKESDQALKNKVRDRVNAEVSRWVERISDIEEARQLIRERLPEIERMVEEVIAEAGTASEFTVDYGKNITFPLKRYGDYVYPPGDYEAILITIGKGGGANWWCVLFPPLCFLDFSFGTTVEAKDLDDEDLEAEADLLEEAEQPKVKFFLFEWLGLF